MDVYVALDGNDRNSGHLINQPVKSFHKALEILRNSHDSSKRLVIRGGDYFNARIELDARDSGLEITALPEEVPVLYGGYREKSWKSEGKFLYAEEERESLELNAVIPTHEWIINLAAEENPVKNVTVADLSLQATNPPIGYMSFAASLLKGAITVRGNAENIEFRNLSIRNSGGKGISVNNYKTGFRTGNITVRDCCFENCGGTAISAPGTNQVFSGNSIKNVGLLYPSASAISCAGTNNVIEHNTIDGCPYIAIHGGGKNCLVKANRISNFMQELDDGAAVYFFAAESCTYRDNITTGEGLKRCASAYYLDERSVNSVIEHNLAVNTGWPNHNHMSNNCTVRGNYFIDKTDSMITFAKSSQFIFKDNVFIAGGDITFRHMNDETLKEVTGNIIFSKSGRIVKSLSGPGGYGSEGEEPFDFPDNIFEDPKLILEGDRITFAQNSPAKNTNITPADFSTAGA